MPRRLFSSSMVVSPWIVLSIRPYSAMAWARRVGRSPTWRVRYRFVYTPGPADGTGRITTYRFDARPVVYGRKYSRSYMCDADGAFHATDEHRAAEPTDSNPNFDAALKEPLPGPCSGPAHAQQQPARPVR